MTMVLVVVGIVATESGTKEKTSYSTRDWMLSDLPCYPTMMMIIMALMMSKALSSPSFVPYSKEHVQLLFLIRPMEIGAALHVH